MSGQGGEGGWGAHVRRASAHLSLPASIGCQFLFVVIDVICPALLAFLDINIICRKVLFVWFCLSAYL